MTLGQRTYGYNLKDADSENFKGEFTVPARAVKEAAAELKADGIKNATFYVGLFHNGPCPTFDASVLIESLQIQAQGWEYGGEYAEGWLDDVTNEDLCELENLLDKVFKKWMHQHGYNPTWRQLIAVAAYQLIDGKPVLIEKGIK